MTPGAAPPASEPGGPRFANLRRLAYFAAVVETGSFTAAAERLGITKAVVSQQVARLEADFRTTLIARTTRSHRLTEAGAAFYRRCATILRDAGEAFDELADVANEPSGTLQLTAPLDYGTTVILPVIAAFQARYPACRVDASLTDQALDLMKAPIELAIRVGWLTEGHLPARRIGDFRQVLVGAPTWRGRLGRDGDPERVVDLPFIANTALRDPERWTFERDGEQRRVTLRPTLFLDATIAVREAARLGLGIAVLPDFTARDDLAAGRLVELLPAWALPSGGIHAVYPTSRFRPARVRAFVDLLAASTGPASIVPGPGPAPAPRSGPARRGRATTR